MDILKINTPIGERLLSAAKALYPAMFQIENSEREMVFDITGLTFTEQGDLVDYLRNRLIDTELGV